MVSVVVPIYNVDKYLRECVDSLRNQTLQDIEIILVDDGSFDESPKICDEYLEKESRIKVIHQKNGGLTVARRSGVNAACGEFVGFVDGDDWIEPDMYGTLLSYAVNMQADMVTSSGYREYSWGKSGERLGDTVCPGLYSISKEDTYLLTHIFSSSYSQESYVNGAVWNKLFRTSVLKDVLNGMDENVHGFMDDNVCVLGAMLKSQKVYVSHDVLYHHRERDGAFGYSNNPRGFMQINYAYLEMKKMLQASPYYNELYGLLCEHTSQRLLQAFNMFFDGQEIKMPQFYLNSSRINVGKKVVIYGAGNVGKSYLQQLKAEKKYEIVALVDKAITGEGIYTPNEMDSLEYDYCIIAVLNPAIAQSIKNELILVGVPQEKIIWEKPISLFEYYNGIVHD